jgi:class 3 adenylate cyclase
MFDDATINLQSGDGGREFKRVGFELVVTDPDGQTTRYPLYFEEIYLGRTGEKNVDIALSHGQLANRQAAFHFRQGSLFFSNLDSDLPIAVNGTPATFSPLKDQDEIRFLDYLVKVHHMDRRLATIEGCTEPYRGSIWGVNEEPVTIGRGTGKRPNVIDLKDRTVSRTQATIFFEDDAFQLQPDTANSPIRINGEEITETTELLDGALIQLGQQLLRFRLKGKEEKRRALIPQEATILFSDVWNYTTFAEGRPLEETINQMNEFYAGLGKVIKVHGGVLLTFLGDAMMAVFGADGPTEEDPAAAVRAALAMHTKLEELNQDWESRGMPTLRIGVGINSGEVMVGDVGFTGKFEFAAMGDNTNLAARVEKLTRDLDAKILITGSTRQSLGEDFQLESMGSTKVKGRETEVKLFRVDGCTESKTR